MTPPSLVGVSPLNRNHQTQPMAEPPTMILHYNTPPRQIERHITQANTTWNETLATGTSHALQQAVTLILKPPRPNPIQPLMQAATEGPIPQPTHQYSAPVRTPTRPAPPYHSPRRQESLCSTSNPTTRNPCKFHPTHQETIITNPHPITTKA